MNKSEMHRLKGHRGGEWRMFEFGLFTMGLKIIDMWLYEGILSKRVPH